jgi:hypothetical protein
MMLRLLFLAALLLVHSGLRAEPAAEKAGFAPRLIIYYAKGPANACGPGCDRIDTLGLGASWTQLLASCPANTARPAAASSNLNIKAAPAIPATSANPAK